MKSQGLTFPSGAATEFHFEAEMADLRRLAKPDDCIVITDETVAGLYKEQLKDYRLLTFPAGEDYKTVETIHRLSDELLQAGANRKTTLLGLGGGVVTDLTGYLAASFMRGIKVGFVPTTLLGQVDAAVGGKNGVNVGLHKNMLGTICQPSFVLFDLSYLNTLPEAHWANGFAEIIKYGFIADVRILNTLGSSDIAYFQSHLPQLSELIAGCVDVKNKIVHADEREDGLRMMLNFGHTAGHALETLCGLHHGQAVGLGMRVAMRLSERESGLGPEVAEQLKALLELYGLPTTVAFDSDEVLNLMLSDKKRSSEGLNYVLLEKPGVAVTKVVEPDLVREALGVIQK
jgi:3-dehydroquinate synthase